MRGFGSEIALPQLPRSTKKEGMNYPIPIVLAAGAQQKIEMNQRTVSDLYCFVHNGGTAMLWFGTVPGVEDSPDMAFGPDTRPGHIRLSNYRGDFVIVAGNATALKATILLTDANAECGCNACDAESLAAALCRALELRDEATANVGRQK